MMRTLVIGGGVAGLATAGLLAREGHAVTLFEQGPTIGGRIGELERNGFRFDTGPSWYLMPQVFDHFFALMGTSTQEQLDLRVLDPGYKVFPEPTDGIAADPVVIPAGAEANLALFERLEPGAGEVLRQYLASATQANSLAERFFLYNPFTRLSSLLATDVLARTPTLVRLLGVSLQNHIARRFRHPVLRQVLGYPAVFLGTEPKAAPAMYHLMSKLDLEDGVQYPMGGFRHLVERIGALAIDAGVQLVTDAQVTRIDTVQSGRRRRARGLTWRDAAGALHTEVADVVVSAADLHHTETQLLAAQDRTYPEKWWTKRTSGPGAVIVLLGVEGKLPHLEHHSLFFTRDWDTNFDAIFGSDTRIPDPASVYVCKPSATDPAVAPEEMENLFILVPVPPDVAIGAGGPDGGGSPTVERTADAVIDQIAAWAGIPDLRERIVVRHTLGPADFVAHYHSWQGGMLGPAHILSQSAMFRAQNASKRVGGLYYVGATTAPGVGVPMCLISAEVVLKRIRGDHSPGPLPLTRAPGGAS